MGKTVNEEQVKQGMRAKLRPKLQRTEKVKDFRPLLVQDNADGGVDRIVADVDVLGLLQGGAGMAMAGETIMQALAGVGELTEEAKEKQREYKLLFGYLAELYGMKIEQGTQLALAIKNLGKYEFMTDTSTGQRALDRAGDLRAGVEKLNSMAARAAELALDIPFTRRDSEFEKLDKFTHEAIVGFEKFSKLMTAVADSVADAMEDEAVKAWIKKHPDAAHKALKGTLYVVDQVINGVEFAGEVMEKVPNPYTSEVAEALQITARFVRAGKALADKAIISADAVRQIEKYKHEHVGGEIFGELDDDPMAIPEMLAKKHKQNVEIVLALISPFIETLADLAPPLGVAWDIINTAIEEAVDTYLERRLQLAREQLGEKDPPDGWAKQFAMNVGDELKDNIFKIFKPYEVLKDAAVNTVIKKINQIIMKYLPIDPAQAVKGEDLLNEMAALHDSFLTSYHVKSEPDVAMFAEFEKPEHDKKKRKIDQILSPIQADEAGEPYQFVRIGDEIGALYRRTGEFRTDDDAPQLGHVERTMIGLMPTADIAGRPVEEVDLSVGFRKSAENSAAADAVTARAALWVRIGDMWGYIDQDRPHKFWARKPDVGAFSDWTHRKIKSDSYKQGKTVVKGTWYRPWPDQHYFLFVRSDDDGLEWARGAQSTGNGPGVRYNVEALLGKKKLARYTDL